MSECQRCPHREGMTCTFHEQEIDRHLMMSCRHSHWAYVTLRRYQDWRTGKDERPLIDSGLSAVSVSQAIDRILEEHGLPHPLVDCSTCSFRLDGVPCPLDKCVREANVKGV